MLESENAARMSCSRVRGRILYVLFFFSGAACLGYQMAWLRMFSTGLGHEMPAALAVVGAFMGGMALGSWSLDNAISRSARPGRWYAFLEILIGLWAFVSTLLIPVANETALQAIGVEPSALRHWSIAFALPLLTILPATAAMGATLPAMERFVSPLVADGRCVGAIYAANTLGAVAGTLMTAFVIVPAVGLRASAWGFGAINLLCGAVALALAEMAKDGHGSRENAAQPPANTVILSQWRLRATIFCTGLLGIGYETAGLRVLTQTLENTVYTFAAVLSVFLLGTAIGAALYQRFLRGRRLFGADEKLLLSDLLFGLAVSGLLGVLALSHGQPLYNTLRSAWGDSQRSVLTAELAVAVAVFGLPTIFMGAIFSHLVQSARREAGGVGRAAALNTFGGAVAPALFGVVLLPAIGSKWTLAFICLGYLAVLPRLTGWRWGLPVLPLLLLPLLPSNLHLVQLPSGATLADYREGVMDSVAVLEDAGGNRTLRVNNRFQMGGTGAADAEYRHAHIPLLLHPAPKRALFLGLGTGITFGAASLYPNLESDGVELVPEVVAVMPQFEPFNFGPNRQASLKLHVADARRFIRATDTRYDVIVADLFHPARDGAGALYTREHFEAARQRLSPGGIFCQWLPLHQLDDSMLRIIVRTFQEVFPDAQAWLLRFNVDAPVVGLMGSTGWPSYSAHWVEKRLGTPTSIGSGNEERTLNPSQTLLDESGVPIPGGTPKLGRHLTKLALGDSIRLFGALLAGPNELRAFAGNAPLNTDDRPRVIFGAPRFTYQKNSNSYGRLLGLLEHRIANVSEVLRFGPEPEAIQFAKRLQDYTSARDVYLKGLVDQTEGRPEKAVDAFIESARLSEDFTPGYAQCLTIASLEGKSNPERARSLLQRLAAAQPSRPVAAEMLKRLGAQ